MMDARRKTLSVWTLGCYVSQSASGRSPRITLLSKINRKRRVGGSVLELARERLSQSRLNGEHVPPWWDSQHMVKLLSKFRTRGQNFKAHMLIANTKQIP